MSSRERWPSQRRIPGRYSITVLTSKITSRSTGLSGNQRLPPPAQCLKPKILGKPRERSHLVCRFRLLSRLRFRFRSVKNSSAKSNRGLTHKLGVQEEHGSWTRRWGRWTLEPLRLLEDTSNLISQSQREDPRSLMPTFALMEGAFLVAL